MRRPYAKDFLGMDMTLNDHHETKIYEHGTAEVDCIEFGNNDPKLKSGGYIAENGDFDACQLTPKSYGTPTDLEFTAGSGHCTAVSEDSKGCIGKSTCSLTVHETILPKCEISREGNIPSLKDDGRNGDHISESCISECLQSADGGGNAEHKEEKNLNLRPRRKSKYLSPPFIEPVKGEPSKSSGDMSIQDSGSPSLVKCGRKKKQPTKPIACPAKLEEITASSAELISQLNILACDCLSPYYNKAFDPAKLFFNRFRASVFRGLSTEEQTRIDKTYAQKKIRTLKQKKAPSGLSEANLNVASSSPLKVDHLSNNIKPQRKRKRKVEPAKILDSGANKIAQIPDLNCVSGVPSATLDPLQVTGQGEIKSEPEKKKRIRKKKTPPVTSSVKPISLGVCLKDAGPYAFAASTVLDSNVGSPPGFCAKGLTPSKPTLSPKLEPMEKVNTDIGCNTNNKSSSGMTLDQMKQSLEFMTSMLEKSDAD
ncbi:hypothetical protein V2J09_003306 [Rumex salicifolius]